VLWQNTDNIHEIRKIRIGKTNVSFANSCAIKLVQFDKIYKQNIVKCVLNITII